MPSDVLTDEQIQSIADEVRRHPIGPHDVVRIIRACGAAAANGVTVKTMIRRIEGPGGSRVFGSQDEEESRG